jgi:hypothetical protein
LFLVNLILSLMRSRDAWRATGRFSGIVGEAAYQDGMREYRRGTADSAVGAEERRSVGAG